jgi:hypothetical protein
MDGWNQYDEDEHQTPISDTGDYQYHNGNDQLWEGAQSPQHHVQPMERKRMIAFGMSPAMGSPAMHLAPGAFAGSGMLHPSSPGAWSGSSSPHSASSGPSSATPIQLHSALSYHPDMPCPFAYDVSTHPSHMRPPPDMPLEQFAEVMTQAATYPPLPTITLVSAVLLHPITVSAKMYGTSHVTVQDVFSAIYASLRSPLSPDEFNGLSPEHQRDVAHAYGARVHRVHERKREIERAKGVKRIDLILAEGTATFNGLGATRRNRALWVLNFRV